MQMAIAEKRGLKNNGHKLALARFSPQTTPEKLQQEQSTVQRVAENAA